MSGGQPAVDPSGQMGPQSPAAERNGAGSVGEAYEVFSIDGSGRYKLHQRHADRGKAFAQAAELKKLYAGSPNPVKVGIKPVRIVVGNLYAQTVKKCRALLKAKKAVSLPETHRWSFTHEGKRYSDHPVHVKQDGGNHHVHFLGGRHIATFGKDEGLPKGLSATAAAPAPRAEEPKIDPDEAKRKLAKFVELNRKRKEKKG